MRRIITLPNLLRRISFAIVCWLSVLACPVLAQDETQAPAGFRTAAELSDSDQKQEIEPGIVVFGRTNRFAGAGDCKSFDVSPDGRTILCVGPKLQLFDLEKNSVREEFGEQGDYYQLAQYSPDGRYILGVTFRNSESVVRIWDAIDLSLVNTVSATAGVPADIGIQNFYVQNMVVSADNAYIALCSFDAVLVRELKSGELVREFPKLGYVQQTAFSPDERQIYLPKSGRVEVFDIESGEPVKRSDSPVANEVSQAVSVNLARNFAALLNGTKVSIKNLEGGNDRILNLPELCYGQKTVFSDDGTLIAVTAWANDGGNNRFNIFVMDVDTGKVIKRLDKIGQNISQVRFSTDGQKLMFAGHGLFGISEVEIHSKQELSENRLPNSPVAFSQIHPDNESFVACTMSGEIDVIDLSTGEIRKKIPFEAGPKGMLLSADGTRIFVYSNSWNGKTSTFDYRSGKQKKDYTIRPNGSSAISRLRTMMLGGGAANTSSNVFPIFVALSENGSELYALGMEITYQSSGSAFSGVDFQQKFSVKFVRFDTETGAELGAGSFKLTQFGIAQEQWVQVGATSRDGGQLAIANGSKVSVVDSGSGETLFELVADDNIPIQQIQYSPDNRFLLTGGSGQSLSIWDRATGELVKSLEFGDGKTGRMLFNFSADGKRMVYCGSERKGAVEIYDTQSWDPVFRHPETQFDRQSISLSKDGQHVVIGLTDCRIEVWDLAKLK